MEKGLPLHSEEPKEPPKEEPSNETLDDLASLQSFAASAKLSGDADGARVVVSKGLGKGTSLLLARREFRDAGLCANFFKLVLEMDPLNLRAAKLLQLSLALHVDPADVDAAREVDQLRLEVASPSSTAATDLPTNPTPRSEISPGFQIVCPGVRKQVMEPGDGVNIPKIGDKLTMHYTGTLAATGVKFDSSVDREEPFEFTVGIGQVIKGWDEGVILMSLGERAILHIASDMAYGDEDVGAGKIPPGSDLDFEVELLAIGDLCADSIVGSGDQSLTDAVMGGIFGGAWSYITGVDLLPSAGTLAEQNMPHAWSLTGCADPNYNGIFTIASSAPKANEHPHYVNENGMHMYYREGWWVHKDIFTPDENSSISRIIGNPEDGSLPQGCVTWEWWRGDEGWNPFSVQVTLKIIDLQVSGCPEDKYNGIYTLDSAAPTANDKPHFSNVNGMHLYYGLVNGWYFKDQFTPHESNATAYSMSVMGANTWQWWNKERAKWINYACTVTEGTLTLAVEPPELVPTAAPINTPAPDQIVVTPAPDPVAVSLAAPAPEESTTECIAPALEPTAGLVTAALSEPAGSLLVVPVEAAVVPDHVV
eukprot:SAG11_NODE_504_length_8890_cov_8.268229_2_plen_593_part_00